jgi:hypothetical protein
MKIVKEGILLMPDTIFIGRTIFSSNIPQKVDDKNVT